LLLALLTPMMLVALVTGSAQAQPVGGPATSGAAGTTASTAPADAPEVKPGQSALEFALEHAPAGVTLEQFVLALIELNPQAFSQGDRLLSGSRLLLPSAEQAGRVPADQARAELLALRATGADNAAARGQAPTPSAEAARPIPEMVWVVCAAALMVLAVLLFRRTRYEGRDRASAGDPEPQTPKTPKTPTSPTPPTEPQPGPPSRYRPALPPESEPIASQPTKAAAMGSTPGQRPLSERADLPSLDLEARATETPAPDIAALDIASPDRPAHLAARPAAPARPLDFSGIDLDLGSPQRDKP
jgi:pilus assembly protein FimV